MTVFISYQHRDYRDAKTADEWLRRHDVPTYFDVFDRTLLDQTEVTEKLLRALRHCTHLMAVVSETTRLSWWVPFEIGVATEREQRIAVFSWEIPRPIDLPDYLRTWPVLKQLPDFAKFAREYHEDASILKSRSPLYERLGAAGAKRFHEALKRSLGQSP